ncbi:MAG: hypothetical protein KA712_04220 [Myxococcales bacterium]|nr:hypothetical protein [Myxococcales bacterium]
MKAPAAPVLWLSLLVACHGGTSSTGNDGDDESPIDPGGSSGTGGGNGNQGGGGGSSAQGGHSAGLGGSSGGGSSGEVRSPCGIRLSALSDTSLTRIVAGPGRTATVQAQVESGRVPPEESFVWQVSFEGALLVAETGGERLTFPVERRGPYPIFVQAGNCSGSTVLQALEANERTTDLWVRVLPPAGANLVPYERTLALSRDGVAEQVLRLAPGVQVSIAPKRASALETDVQIPAFVRVVPKESTFRWEGHTAATGRFEARVDPFLVYDVLLVPESDFAPVLLGAQTTQMLGSQSFRLDSGTLVQGTALAASGNVAGVRVLLRAGALPSTLATSDAQGRFTLRASAARYGVTVRAPENAALPDLELPEAEGVTVTPQRALLPLSVTWQPYEATQVVLRVRLPDGLAPLPDAEVELATRTPLPNAGVLRVDQGPAQALLGKVVRRGTTDAEGQVVFLNVPRGSYRVRVTPPRRPGLVQRDHDIQLDATSAELTLDLPRPVTLTGQLAPAPQAAGALIQAYDTDAPAAAPFVATVDSQGGYALQVAPQRTYRLRAVPAAPAPAFPMASVSVQTADLPLPPRTLPLAMPFAGRVTSEAGLPLAGAVVQLFCWGEGSDCVSRSPDGTLLSVATAIPLGEITTDETGQFALSAIDPASP